MANNILNSIGRLNQYLGLEVAKKEQKDRENLVNQTGSDISSIFAGLGAEASPAEVTKATFKAMEYAGKTNTLKDNMPVIASLTQASMGLSRYSKEQRDLNELSGALQTSLGINASGMSANSSLQYLKSMQASTKWIQKDEGAYANLVQLRPSNGVYKEIGEPIRIGESKAVIENRRLKNNMALSDYSTNNNLRLAMSKANIASGTSNVKSNDLSAVIKASTKEAEAAANNIVNQLNPELDLSLVKGGSIGYAKSLAMNVEKMVKTVFDSDIPGKDNKLLGIKFPGAQGYTSETGAQLAKGETGVPEALRDDYIQLALSLEKIDRANKQLANTFLDHDVSKASAEQLNALYYDFGEKVTRILADPTQAHYGNFEKLIRRFTNDTATPIAELWDSMTTQQKAPILNWTITKEAEARNKNIK